MKKRRKPSAFYKVFSILLLIISLLLIGLIAYLGVLSLTYLLLVAGIILLIDGIFIGLMLWSRKRKLGLFLGFVFMLILGVASFYVNKTTGLLTDLELNYKTYNYAVVVLENSSIKKLNDIEGKTLGYYDDRSDESKRSLEKLEKKVMVEEKSYEDTYTMAAALLDKEIDVLLLEKSYLDILDENISDGEDSFKDRVREVYHFSIVVHTNDISKDINVVTSPFNIYVSGIDTYGEISSVSRSDVNMIVTVNPDTQQILLTSVPRDYYVSLHGKSGYRDKLTHAGLYGVDMSIQTLEDLLDIEINYYVKVNFSSVIDIVNAIDGVNVYSDYEFNSIDNYHYSKGYNAVNGEEALSFARERKAFAAGDRQRIKNQQALLKAIFEKCTGKAIITRYSKLLDSLDGSFVTNIKMSRLTSLIRLQLVKNYTWNMVVNSLSGTDSSNYTYSAPSQKAYVMEPVTESVEHAHDLIRKVLDGGILEKEETDVTYSGVNQVTKPDNHSNSKEDNSSLDKEDTYFNQESDGLKAKLVRSDVSFVSGDEYVYHGYTATYDGKDITNDLDIVNRFSINGKSFDDYRDLVYYVSGLESGDYVIIYTIQYQGESVILNQSVTISELISDGVDDDKDKDKNDSFNEDSEDKDVSNGDDKKKRSR